MEISRADIPTISLTDTFHRCLCAKREKSIILKTIAPSKSLETLKSCLQKLWKVRGDFKIRNLGHNYYLVSDLSEEDRLRLLTARTWKLGDFPLLLRSWVPNFSMKDKAEERIAAWVKINFLTTELHTVGILQEIGNLLGKTLAFQVNFGNQAHQVRICVEVNLDSKLLN